MSQRPALRDAVPWGTLRASAIIMAIACSAVVMTLPSGVFMTTTPRLVAAGISTLSSPMPARPTTFKAARTDKQVFSDLGGTTNNQGVVITDDFFAVLPGSARF